MRRPFTLAAALVGSAIVLSSVLTGCTGSTDDPDSYTSGMADEPVNDTDDADRLDGVPQECIDALPYVIAPADFADVEHVPDGWPEAPAGSTLCMTAGGSMSTATYVTQQPIDEVLSHYESALSPDHETYRVSGADNGTGYEALDGGDGGEFTFQIRENDTGFVVVLSQGEM